MDNNANPKQAKVRDGKYLDHKYYELFCPECTRVIWTAKEFYSKMFCPECGATLNLMGRRFIREGKLDL
ncbi:MAG: hypothetical protein NUV97_04445 [archaeon]|nr:hypothetical protein [archaeon]